MNKDPFSLSVVQTLDALILGELNQMIYSNEQVKSLEIPQPSPFIKFLPIAVCIEFIGACYDEHPFNSTGKQVKDINEKRFNKALKELFPKSYLQFSKANSPHYLYKHFRCGMAHQLRPSGKIVFTTRREAMEAGRSHLEQDSLGLLLLVLENLYDDLAKASEKLKAKFENGQITNQKGSQGYIGIIPMSQNYQSTN